MRVVMIDDGVSGHLAVSHGIKTYQVVKGKEVHLCDAEERQGKTNGHGMVCASILLKYAPEIELISIKALEEDGTCDVENIYTALEWCLDKDVMIISLSLGTVWQQDYFLLQGVIHRLTDAGVFVAAAVNNRGIFSSPACISGVIPVAAGENQVDSNVDFGFLPPVGTVVYASGRHILRWGNECMITPVSNSYAVPSAVAYLVHLLKKNPITPYDFFRNHDWIFRNIDFLEKAVVLGQIERKEAYCFEVLQGEPEKTGVQGKSIVVKTEFCESEQVCEFIQWLKGNPGIIKHLVWCGILNEESRHLIKNSVSGLVWEPAYLLRKEDLQGIPSGHEKIPVLTVKGCAEYVYECNRALVERGYNSVCISRQKQAFLYGMEYIPEEWTDNDCIAYYEHYFSAEILIIWEGEAG